MPLDIRDLANRAELDFQRRPHRFRRVAWWSGVVLALACWGWLLAAMLVDDHRVYEAGPLSKAHAFIANDCRQCHTTWQPVRRLTTGDAQVSSISNSSCLKCHAAAEHQPHQVPAHNQMSCAECHREHQGRMQLADVTDQHCVRCHADLKTTDGSSRRFASHIKGFGGHDGHPEFNLMQRLKSESSPSNLITPDELKDLLKMSSESGNYQRRFLDVLRQKAANVAQQSPLKWQDRGEIKFNHAAHLDPTRIKDKHGQHVDLSRNCQACHVADDAGQYMRPIHFEQHCAQCHPLWFDNQNHPGDEVPHARPDVVRGFLTEKYTLTVLRDKTPLKAVQPARPLPGQADRPSLAVDPAQRLAELVSQAEKLVQDHGRIAKSRGGCRLCHTIDESKADGDWTIRPPQIPDRWLPHSRFHHQAHRMLGCVECHAGVSTKQDTADVMLPGIADCRDCHVSPRTATLLSSGRNSQPASAHEVPSSCVMCHSYHRPTAQAGGTLDKRLQPRAVQR